MQCSIYPVSVGAEEIIFGEDGGPVWGVFIDGQEYHRYTEDAHYKYQYQTSQLVTLSPPLSTPGIAFICHSPKIGFEKDKKPLRVWMSLYSREYTALKEHA